LLPLVAQQSTSAPTPSPLPGFVYDVPFFPDAHHDPAIPTPDSILGFPVGQRPTTHAQIEACLKAWAGKSPRTKLFEHGKTHEGRTLYHIAISSEANIKRLEQIKADLAKLADPRSIAAADADRLAATLPGVAWMAYTIHGDEMSGSDAALALAWHLIAGTDESVRKMLDELVIIIDPLMNPDGRDRFINQIAIDRTMQPSIDDQSLIHSGPWPAGRTNHYLFDLNRDWLLGVHPESRGRLAAIGAWHPQLLVDAHEMGSQDSFLFSPPREPVNPNVAPTARNWWEVFSKAQAAAFDKFGWRYYHGEWNEELYPGYSTSWAAFHGAITILFEQATIASDAVRRREGTLQTYREAVHHQLVGSLSILSTFQANRAAILRDFLAQRRQAMAEDSPYARRTFAVVPSANRARLREFIELVQLHGLEVYTAGKSFTASNGKDRLGRPFKDRQFPAGTILIPNRQPEARLAAAILEFDTRMSSEFLQEERHELLRFNRSRLYDTTAWNLTMLHDVEAYELSQPLPDGAERYAGLPAEPPPRNPAPDAPVAFVIDGADDASVVGAARLLERGIQVRVSNKPFALDEQAFARGSVVVTKADNREFTGDLAGIIAQVANELHVRDVPIKSGLGAGDVPDLGGEHFVLLDAPRIAVLTRDPFSRYSFGEIWHLIDRTLGIRASYIDRAELRGTDLRRYNVLVIPEGAGDSLKDRLESLKSWVTTGGTLIAIGSSAAAIARLPEADVASPLVGGAPPFTTARLLPDVLTKLDDYSLTVVREWEGRYGAIDPDVVWSQTAPAEVTFPWSPLTDGKKPADEELKRRDKWRSIFMPQGAILAARVDDRSWLTSGCGDYVPVLFHGDTVLMAAGVVQAPVRLGAIVPTNDATTRPSTRPASAPATQGATAGEGEKSTSAHWAPTPPGYELRLRMSGLLWPEAADRLAHSAYVTRESVGAGQIILFAASPTFRGSTKGTLRIFSNALIYGPGMGASPPIRL
jgi:hypothetical protein